MNAEQIFDSFLKTPEAKKTKGTGKKECPECNTIVGARKLICECGYKFSIMGKKLTKQEKYEFENKATDEEKMYAMRIGSGGGRIVYAASGSPPTRLNSLDYNGISDYCEIVISYGRQESKVFTVTAIKHWLQHELGYNSEEYKIACGFVDEWCDYKMGIKF